MKNHPWVGMMILLGCSSQRVALSQQQDFDRGRDAGTRSTAHRVDGSVTGAPHQSEATVSVTDAGLGAGTSIAERKARAAYLPAADPLRPCRELSSSSSRSVSFKERRDTTGLEVGRVPFSIAVGLVDDDDLLDIVLQSSTSNSDLSGAQTATVHLGKGHFAEPLGPYQVGGPKMNLADVNGDGLHDSANWSLVALARPDGSLEATQRLGEWNGLRVWADFNRDSILDTAFGRLGGDLEVSLGLGDLQFAEPLHSGTDVSSLVEAQVVDVDGDANLDLVGIVRTGPPDEPHDSQVTVMFGDGSGRFSEPEQALTLTDPVSSVRYGDFNCDLRADLVMFGDANPIRVVFREKEGWSEPLALYANTHPSDQEATASGSVAGAVGDFNGDGSHDLVTSTVLATQASGGHDVEHRGHVSVFFGDGKGGFSEPRYLESSLEQRYWGSVAAADVNADGMDDFVTSVAFPKAAASNPTQEFSVWTSALSDQ